MAKKKTSVSKINLNAPAKKKKRNIKSEIGTAPEFVKGEAFDIEQGRYYYNYNIAPPEAAKMVSAYLRKNRKSVWNQVSKLPSWKYSFSHVALYCDALADGAILPEETSIWLEAKFDELVAEAKAIKPAKEEVAKKKAYVPTIQEKMRDKRDDLIGEMESWEDNGDWDVDVFAWLKDNSVAQQHLKIMIAYWEPMLAEMQALQAGKDKELVEGYNLSKASVKRYIALYKRILKDLESYNSTKSATRKVRTKKQPSKEKLVAKVVYKKEDTEYKVASVNPAGIIGATQVWFFDTVRRQLGVYNVDPTAGTLGIKGAGIVGYCEKTSTQKTVRKPGDVLPLVIKGSKPKLRKLLDTVKATAKPVKSRFNKNTIILRIV